MNGDAIAQFDLGLMYDLGEGVAQDYAIALIWYRKAAEQGEQGESFLGRKWLIGKKIKKELDKPEGLSHAKMV